jgi:hypothetical protein
MTEHLSKEQLNLLSNHQLRGKEFVNALKHLESCQKCENNYPKRPANEIIREIFADPPQTINSTQEKTPPIFLSGWRLVPATGFGILLLIAGVGFWLINGKYSSEVNRDVVTVSNSNQLPIWQETPANIAIENANIVPESSVETNKSVDLTRNLSANSNATFDNPKITNKSIARPAEQNSSQKAENINQEKSRLQKFLTTVPLAVANLRPTSSPVRSGGHNLKVRLLSPFSEVIKDTNVDFSWAKIENAVAYQLTVFDKSYTEIANKTLTTSSFRLENALKRGNVYFWKVTATDAKGEPLTPTNSQNVRTFRVADEKTILQLNKIKQSKDDWKILGFLIESGMLSEAKSKLRALSAKFPNEPLIKKLDKRIKTLLNY